MWLNAATWPLTFQVVSAVTQTRWVHRYHRHKPRVHPPTCMNRGDSEMRPFTWAAVKFLFVSSSSPNTVITAFEIAGLVAGRANTCITLPAMNQHGKQHQLGSHLVFALRFHRGNRLPTYSIKNTGSFVVAYCNARWLEINTLHSHQEY